MQPNWSIITDQWDADHYGIRGKMSILIKWKSLLDSFLVWDWFHFPRTKSIGSNDFLYKSEHFSSTMSIERFESILRFSNFGGEPMFDNDMLSKIRMIIEHFNKTMLELITPEKNLSIDESMMLWRWHLIFRQYIKNKRHKYGIKFFELCTHDGLVLSTEIYDGQGFNNVKNLQSQTKYLEQNGVIQ